MNTVQSVCWMGLAIGLISFNLQHKSQIIIVSNLGDMATIYTNFSIKVKRITLNSTITDTNVNKNKKHYNVHQIWFIFISNYL